DVGINRVRLDIGYQAGRYGEVRLGIARGTIDASVNVGRNTFPETEFDFGGLILEANLDRLDNAAVPRSGSAAGLIITRADDGFGSTDDYTKVEFTSALFGSRGPHTLFVNLDVGVSPGSELPIYDEFSAGGFSSLSGFQQNELTGQALGVLRLGYYHEIGLLPLGFGNSVVFGGWIEAGNVWEDEDDAGIDDLLYTATLALGADTAFGPVYLGYGWAESGDDQLYLSVGSTF
ncbi:MAG: BamA/TamA family outer membrane protein, partial [Acidobacteriota bacterium]